MAAHSLGIAREAARQIGGGADHGSATDERSGLQDAFSADAGFELGVLGRRGRRLANVRWRGSQLAKADVGDLGEGGRGLQLSVRGAVTARRAADFLVMAGTPCDGRARDVSRPGKPVSAPRTFL